MTSGSGNLDDAISEINGFRELKENWDSNGGKSIDQRSISDGLRVVVAMHLRTGMVPKAVPTSKGGVQLEYDSQEGYDGIELELMPDRSVSVLLSKGTERAGIKVEDFCREPSKYIK